MDRQLKMSVCLLLAVDRIVQILRVRPVDGDDRKSSEIGESFFHPDIPRQILCLIQYIFGKFMRQTMLCDDDIDIKTLIAFVADDFRHAALRIRPFPRPASDFDDDTRPRGGIHFLPLRDLDVHIHLLVDRYGFTAILQHLIGADEGIIGTL